MQVGGLKPLAGRGTQLQPLLRRLKRDVQEMPAGQGGN